MREILLSTGEYAFRRYGRWWSVALAIGVVGLASTVASGDTRGAQIAIGVSFYAVLGFGLTVPGGLVEAERQSGLLLLWHQQPGSLMAFYLRRALVGLAVAQMFVVPLALLGAVGDLLNEGRTLAELPANAIGLIWMGALAGAVTVAASSWGIARDSFFSLLYFLGSLTVGSLLAFEALETGDSSPLGVVLFPIDTIQRITSGEVLAGSTIFLVHILAWLAIAAVGLRRVERRPLPK